MADIKSIAEELVNPTANETKGLITILRDEYGIKPAASKLRAIRVITKY